MFFYFNIFKTYYLYLIFSFFLFFYNSLDYYIHYIYNYILYLHIAFIIISYILFFILFFYYLFSIYGFSFFNLNISLIGIFSTFYTLFIGVIWGYSIWKTFTFFDIRILFIIILFFFFFFDLLFPTFNIKYKIFLFYICFIHFFTLKIKINWTSQIHQSNNFFSFFSHLPLLDIFFFFFLFVIISFFLFYIQFIKEYIYSLKNNIVKNI